MATCLTCWRYTLPNSPTFKWIIFVVDSPKLQDIIVWQNFIFHGNMGINCICGMITQHSHPLPTCFDSTHWSVSKYFPAQNFCMFWREPLRPWFFANLHLLEMNRLHFQCNQFVGFLVRPLPNCLGMIMISKIGSTKILVPYIAWSLSNHTIPSMFVPNLALHHFLCTELVLIWFNWQVLCRHLGPSSHYPPKRKIKCKLKFVIYPEKVLFKLAFEICTFTFFWYKKQRYLVMSRQSKS